MEFKSGMGWKTCCESKAGTYTAEYGGCGAYHLYELGEEICGRLNSSMTEGDACVIISDGRRLYMDINDRCGPPYTVVFDDNYKKMRPWASIVSSGKVWPDELTDAAVELFESEKKDREQRRKKRENRRRED